MCRELLLAELGPPFVIAFGVPTLQWGRDQLIAELSSNSSDQKQSMNLLQWGREQSFAETAPRAAVAGCAARGVLTVWTDDPPPLTQRVSHVIQVYGLFTQSCRILVARPYWIIRGTTQGAPASEDPSESFSDIRWSPSSVLRQVGWTDAPVSDSACRTSCQSPQFYRTAPKMKA